MGGWAEAARLLFAAVQPVSAVGSGDRDHAERAGNRRDRADRQARAARAGGGLDRDAHRQAAAVPCARTAGRFIRTGAALGHVFFSVEVKRWIVMMRSSRNWRR